MCNPRDMRIAVVPLTITLSGMTKKRQPVDDLIDTLAWLRQRAKRRMIKTKKPKSNEKRRLTAAGWSKLSSDGSQIPWIYSSFVTPLLAVAVSPSTFGKAPLLSMVLKRWQYYYRLIWRPSLPATR